MQKIIYFNIGWMKKYQGQTDTDRIISGFKFVQEENIGHEIYNFLPDSDGSIYGYVPLKWGDSGGPSSIGIERIGAGKHDEYISGVTVVFFSKDLSGIARVVGWYTDAIVFRSPIELKKKEYRINGSSLFYYIKANYENTVCLPEHLRTLEVPYSKGVRGVSGGYGQNPIWYADSDTEEIIDFNKNVFNLIKSDVKEKANEEHFEETQSSNMSAADKKKIETIAVNATIAYYEQNGYKVVSTERDNCGWDLEVTKNDETLYVEVKGTASRQITFQLTPNEYSKLKKFYKRYKIASVRECFSKNPILEVFDISIVKRNKQTFYKGTNDKTTFYLMERVEIYASPAVEVQN